MHVSKNVSLLLLILLSAIVLALGGENVDIDRSSLKDLVSDSGRLRASLEGHDPEVHSSLNTISSSTREHSSSQGTSEYDANSSLRSHSYVPQTSYTPIYPIIKVTDNILLLVYADNSCNEGVKVV